MYKLLETRRSIRKFKQDKVKKETVDLLIKSILRSPSGKNIRPWEFIYVNDEALMTSLSKCKQYGSRFLSKTPQCIIVLVDESQSDIWIEEGAIAMTIGHLSAHALDLGSCWVQIRNRNTETGSSSETFVQTIFNIPSHLRVEGILAFGYADEEKKGVEEAVLLLDKVKINGYKKHLYE